MDQVDLAKNIVDFILDRKGQVSFLVNFQCIEGQKICLKKNIVIKRCE